MAVQGGKEEVRARRSGVERRNEVVAQSFIKKKKK